MFLREEVLELCNHQVITLGAHAPVFNSGIQVRTTLRQLEVVTEATAKGYLSGGPQNNEPYLTPDAQNMAAPQSDEMAREEAMDQEL